MKTFRMFSMVALVVAGWMTSFGQAMDAEVPGDHFSLEGALELFKKSSSPEEFEKMLNSPDSKVNNLDLNGDGYIDYVRVHDRYKGDVHAFILQAVISEDELQDIAVIELEKLSNGKAVLQIIGDEDIYGITTIIEPTKEVRTYAGTQTSRTVVNVWAWPSVQYVYGPYYRGWASPWGWYHRPVWWSSWRPIAYVHYHPIWRPYHRHYVVCHTRRVIHAHDIYRPYRRSSVIVHHRHRDRVVHYRDRYRDGYRRNDGRTYARDDRSRTRNDFQRANDVQRRNDDATRARSTNTREVAAPVRQDRSITERNANAPRQRQVPGVTDNEPVRRTAPERKVSRDVVSPQQSRSRAATPVPQPNIRQEAPRRTEMKSHAPGPVTRSAPASRSPEVNRRRAVPTSAKPSTAQRSRELPADSRRSSAGRPR